MNGENNVEKRSENINNNQVRSQNGCRHQLMDRILFQEHMASLASNHSSTANMSSSMQPNMTT